MYLIRKKIRNGDMKKKNIDEESGEKKKQR